MKKTRIVKELSVGQIAAAMAIFFFSSTGIVSYIFTIIEIIPWDKISTRSFPLNYIASNDFRYPLISIALTIGIGTSIFLVLILISDEKTPSEEESPVK